MLYSASQLLDKTMLLNKTAGVYNVIDIINFGDQAKPSYTMVKGTTFVLYSFLLPTQGYTDSYGIHYAKRSNVYFLFYDTSGKFLAIKLTSGLLSLEALREQGALSIKEQIEAEKNADKSWYEKLFGNIFGEGTLGTVITIGATAIGLGYLLTKASKNNKS